MVRVPRVAAIVLVFAACADDVLTGPEGPTTPTASTSQPTTHVPPVAVIALASPDLDAPRRATFDGQLSYDPDNPAEDALAGYRWRLASGPANAVLSSTDAPTASIDLDTPGTYVVELVVIDRDALSSAAARLSIDWVPVDAEGDCVTFRCPATAPFVVGCAIRMPVGRPVGCIAHVPGSGEVFVQEGLVCAVGHLEGTVYCSTQPGGPLNAENCPMDKEEKHYVERREDCPSED